MNNREEVFNYLQGMNYNIHCLQDTQFTIEVEDDFKNMGF